MKRVTGLVAAVLLVLSVSNAGNTATASHISAKLDYHVADAFIASFTGIPQTGAVAQASNGHTVTVTGSGTFNTASMKATGGGTFVHLDQEGNLVGSGTWSATGVQSFTWYGCFSFAPNVCGGLLVLSVQLTGPLGTFGATMSIDCLIGDFPEGAMEGIKLAVPDVGINFDTILFSPAGLTVYVARSHTPGD